MIEGADISQHYHHWKQIIPLCKLQKEVFSCKNHINPDWINNPKWCEHYSSHSNIHYLNNSNICIHLDKYKQSKCTDLFLSLYPV